MRINLANSSEAQSVLAQLNDLLINAVTSGASIGFLPPLSQADAEAYWRGRIEAIEDGGCILLLAWEDDVLVGSAQLGLERRANGNHRAEVQKVMVHTDFRRRGIGKLLMLALEDVAIKDKRSLLVLDTRQGDPSEKLYRQLGYIEVGTIPQYARSATGDLHATAFYYKILSNQ